jgi:Flp pilus assembly protein TadG
MSYYRPHLPFTEWRQCVRFNRDDRGSALVELAISLLLLLTILFSTLELGSAVYTYTVLADAANEGVRYAIVNHGDSTGTSSVVRAYAAYSLHDVTGMTVTITAGTSPGDLVTVSVSYPYLPWLSAFMSSPPTMAAYAESRIVY